MANLKMDFSDELLNYGAEIKMELTKQLKERNISIDFEDEDKSIKHLVLLKLSTNCSAKSVVNDFIEYYLEHIGN